MKIKRRKTKVSFPPRHRSLAFPSGLDGKARSGDNIEESGVPFASNEAGHRNASKIHKAMNTAQISEEIVMANGSFLQPAPELFTNPPRIKDALTTQSLTAQYEVIDQCLPYLTGEEADPSRLNSQSIPKLEREKHIDFLEKAIKNARFVVFDASRPWVVYWSLTGLCILGRNIEVYRERYMITIAIGSLD